MTGNEEIVRLATLHLALDQGPEDVDAKMEFEQGLDRLEREEILLVTAALKLLKGKPYAMSTDNPSRVARWRSLAEHMGAPVRTCEEEEGMTHIIFDAPCRN